MILTVKTLRTMRARSERVLEPELLPFLDEKVLPSNWYDEDDFMGLLEALVRILPPQLDIWEWVGAAGAEADFTTVYSAFVQKGRPEFAISRYPRIWRLYHDNGGLEVKLDRDRGTIDGTGYMLQNPNFARLQAGHFRRLLELGGARDVAVRLVRPATGSSPGRWDLAWQV